MGALIAIASRFGIEANSLEGALSNASLREKLTTLCRSSVHGAFRASCGRYCWID